MNSNECVFLTRGELHIHSDNTLSVHLKPEDSRIEDILRLVKLNQLQIVTIDPKKINFYKSFFSNNWYLIPTLEYTGCAKYSGYSHFSFTYKLDGYLSWDKKGVRLLTSDEIDRVRKTLSLG